ncbi:hypothetical protein BKA70DRAFT_675352 [Coprinopsis sp. MPI-PUGE-AT-0042]|nr:hypothetical protein BKA70DRAFT_675352 [Coprinopsis sp. MPI-PUGE-AT-0042]
MMLQIIAAAKSGSLQGLAYLASLVDTDIGRRYALEVLKIFFLYLEPSLVPDIDDIRRRNPGALSHGSRGTLSLTGVASVLPTVYTFDPASLKVLTAQFAAIILRKLDHIAAWFRYFLNPLSSIEPNVPPGARQTSDIDQFMSFLATAGHLSIVLLDALWEHDGILDLIIDIWFIRNGDIDPSDLVCKLPGFKKEDYYMSTIKHGYNKGLITLSIPSILRQILIPETSRQTMMVKLFRRLESDRNGKTDSHVQLAATILSRIDQVRSRVEIGHYPAAYALESLELLVEIMRILTGWVESDALLTGDTPYDPLAPSLDCRKLYHSLYKADYVGTVTSTLLSISNEAATDSKATSSEPSACFVAATLAPNCLLTKLYPEPASHVKLRIQSMLDNGVLQLIANAALIWHKSHSSFREEQAKHDFDSIIVFRSLFIISAQAACYPSLVYALHRAFNRLSREQWILLNQSCTAAAGKVQLHYPESAPHHDWAAEFNRQSSHWLALFTQFRTSWRNMLCDSETHYLGADSASYFKRQARRCMGCHSAVYCSIPCQKADWNQRHREECRDRRLGVPDIEMDGALKCSPRTRAWHILLLQDFVCNGGWTPTFLNSIDSPAGSHVARVQFYRVPFNVESTKTLAEYQPPSPLIRRSSRRRFHARLPFVVCPANSETTRRVTPALSFNRGCICLVSPQRRRFSHAQAVHLRTSCWIRRCTYRSLYG